MMMLITVMMSQCTVNADTSIHWRSAQVDGSVVVWDLHESWSLNESYTDSNGNEFQLRQPTYNTGMYRVWQIAGTVVQYGYV